MTALMFDPWQWIRDNAEEPAPAKPETLATLATLAAADEGLSLPAGWRVGLAQLRDASRPPSCSAESWARLVADTFEVADKWAPQALALGWTAVDLFGVDPEVSCRPGRVGLCAALEGRKVVAVTSEAATLVTRSGGILRHYRRDKAGAVPVWEATKGVQA